jgi:hypothetical protein
MAKLRIFARGVGMDDDELQRLITNSPEMIDVISNEGVSG